MILLYYKVTLITLLLLYCLQAITDEDRRLDKNKELLN